jgi:hypothetical protein
MISTQYWTKEANQKTLIEAKTEPCKRTKSMISTKNWTNDANQKKP